MIIIKISHSAFSVILNSTFHHHLSVFVYLKSLCQRVVNRKLTRNCIISENILKFYNFSRNTNSILRASAISFNPIFRNEAYCRISFISEYRIVFALSFLDNPSNEYSLSECSVKYCARYVKVVPF